MCVGHFISILEQILVKIPNVGMGKWVKSNQLVYPLQASFTPLSIEFVVNEMMVGI